MGGTSSLFFTCRAVWGCVSFLPCASYLVPVALCRLIDTRRRSRRALTSVSRSSCSLLRKWTVSVEGRHPSPLVTQMTTGFMPAWRLCFCYRHIVHTPVQMKQWDDPLHRLQTTGRHRKFRMRQDLWLLKFCFTATSNVYLDDRERGSGNVARLYYHCDTFYAFEGR